MSAGSGSQGFGQTMQSYFQSGNYQSVGNPEAAEALFVKQANPPVQTLTAAQLGVGTPFMTPSATNAKNSVASGGAPNSIFDVSRQPTAEMNAAPAAGDHAGNLGQGQAQAPPTIFDVQTAQMPANGRENKSAVFVNGSFQPGVNVQSNEMKACQELLAELVQYELTVNQALKKRCEQIPELRRKMQVWEMEVGTLKQELSFQVI